MHVEKGVCPRAVFLLRVSAQQLLLLAITGRSAFLPKLSALTTPISCAGCLPNNSVFLRRVSLQRLILPPALRLPPAICFKPFGLGPSNQATAPPPVHSDPRPLILKGSQQPSTNSVYVRREGAGPTCLGQPVCLLGNPMTWHWTASTDDTFSRANPHATLIVKRVSKQRLEPANSSAPPTRWVFLGRPARWLSVLEAACWRQIDRPIRR